LKHQEKLTVNFRLVGGAGEAVWLRKKMVGKEFVLQKNKQSLGLSAHQFLCYLLLCRILRKMLSRSFNSVRGKISSTVIPVGFCQLPKSIPLSNLTSFLFCFQALARAKVVNVVAPQVAAIHTINFR
jgi:hypothetical protein